MILYKNNVGDYHFKNEGFPVICANFVEYYFNTASPKIRVQYSLKHKKGYLKVTIWSEDHNKHRHWYWIGNKFAVPQDMYSRLDSIVDRKFPVGGKHNIYLKITSL